MRKDRTKLQINRQLRRRPLLDQIRPHSLVAILARGLDQARKLMLDRHEFSERDIERAKSDDAALATLANDPFDRLDRPIEEVHLLARDRKPAAAHDPRPPAADP